MSENRRPGPKPKRLFIRVARWPSADPTELPSRRAIRETLENLERVGRLVAHGPLDQPPGDLLIIRAVDSAEANRVLRTDPIRNVPNIQYEVVEWDPTTFGSGVNLDPPPARGSGRLTLVQRVAVVVSDQTQSVRWYRDVLGFVVRVQDPDSGYVELALGTGTVALSLITPRPEWGEPHYSETRARIGIRTGIAFQTDSVAALELRLRNAGAQVTQSAQAEPWGGRQIRFQDPDGNEFLAFESGGPSTRTGGRPSRPES
ncbi:MAG: VOC family protein [Thermoplasmata archaeon]